MVLDRAKLARFLTIAHQSQHDGEAINALRFAGRMLDAASISFNDLIIGRVSGPSYHTPKPAAPEAPPHKAMLDRLLTEAKMTAKTRYFLESLLAGHDEYGRLTPKQAEVLERIYNEKFPQESK